MYNKALHSDDNSAALHCHRWAWALCLNRNHHYWGIIKSLVGLH